MKIYISADMEGATGVTYLDHVSRGTPSYERFRRFLTKDVNAAIEGAIEAGATEIIVNEAHGPMINILLEELNPKAKMISGRLKPLGMMEGIDKSFDAAFFIGYHARAGTQAAILSHTIGLNVTDLQINGKSFGELGMNAQIAGYYDVPVVLVTGDDKTCKEANEFLGDVGTVQVKEGIEQITANCLPPAITSKLIKESAIKALTNLSQFVPVKCKSPVTVEIEFFLPAMAASAALIPSVQRIAPKRIQFTLTNYVDAMKMRTAAIRLGSLHQNIPI
jgi:D-amino peptidase